MDQYGVIGNPIHHSKSPIIHQLFAEQTGQVLHYSPMLVSLDGLREALTEFQWQGGKGVNITSPFKQEAFDLVDSLSDQAKQARAINTIKFNEDGTRFGDNTDGIGLVRDISINFQYPLKDKQILMLGAGGAARGVLASILHEKPAAVVVANRTAKKAALLAEDFAEMGIIKAASLSVETGCFDLIINATSASLSNEMLDLPSSILHHDTFCYDMVYGKDMTPFLSWAKENGVRYADGIGMLVEQASESFYTWHKIKPDTRAVLSYLKEKVLPQNLFY